MDPTIAVAIVGAISSLVGLWINIGQRAIADDIKQIKHDLFMLRTELGAKAEKEYVAELQRELVILGQTK